ncbi:MAG TPA: cytochrome c oxidase assembly factor Coa1 family protein [Pyrinomonadaceae bacterium]|jgi:TonB family protein
MMNPNQAQFGGSFQQPPQPQRKGCLGRNWKWMLPVGCLGLILGGVLLFGGIVYVAMSAIKSSDVYRGALGVAQAHPAAVERLGQPVKDGWFVQGNINYSGGGGNANFEIPVSGPKKSGTLRVSAVNSDGAWMYEKLDLAVEGGETVSLLDRNVARPAAGAPVDVEEDADDEMPEAEEGGAAEPDTTSPSGGQTVPGGALDAKAVSKPQPPYPPLAKAARAAGTVVVQVGVDETGRVVAASAVSGHPLLRAAAVEAAKQARFPPTLLDGRPVGVTGTLTYNFEAGQ